MKKLLKENAGFTLIEISVVIIIIAMIVAGIISGSSLMRNTEIKTIATDFQKFEVAISSFVHKYNNLPGDITTDRAKSYWPDGSQFTGFVTIGGDANERIDSVAEGYAAWQHLSLANLIKIRFSGVGDTSLGAAKATPKVNIPTSKIINTGYILSHTDAAILGGNTIFEKSGAFIYAGRDMQVAGDYLGGGILNPDDAIFLDKKMDDGYADSGKIFISGTAASGTNCVTNGTDSATAGALILTYTEPSCFVRYWMEF